MADKIDTYFPVVPGWDVAGVVEQAGPGAAEFAAGDEVIGYVRGTVEHRGGAYAEKIAANVQMIARKPRNFTWAQAAALPLAGLTAYQALRALAVAAGETLLVHAAAGGVGSLAAQLGVARGARVIGTASPANHDYLRSLGVEPVEYGDGLGGQVRALAPRGVDAVLDTAGRDTLHATPEFDGARVASVAQFDHPGAIPVFARSDPADLAALVDLAEAGALAVRIANTFPLERAADAHRAVADGHVPGRIVLVP